MNGHTSLNQAADNSNVAFHATWMRDFRKALARIEPSAVKNLRDFAVQNLFREGYTANTAADRYASIECHRSDLWD